METLLSILLVTFIVATISTNARQNEFPKLSGPYLGQKTPGTTAEPKLGMNAGQPFISFDGKYLFFTTGDPGINSDILWVSTKSIEDLRLKK